jgi:hypothetical protein
MTEDPFNPHLFLKQEVRDVDLAVAKRIIRMCLDSFLGAFGLPEERKPSEGQKNKWVMNTMTDFQNKFFSDIEQSFAISLYYNSEDMPKNDYSISISNISKYLSLGNDELLSLWKRNNGRYDRNIGKMYHEQGTRATLNFLKNGLTISKSEQE